MDHKKSSGGNKSGDHKGHSILLLLPIHQLGKLCLNNYELFFRNVVLHHPAEIISEFSSIIACITGCI